MYIAISSFEISDEFSLVLAVKPSSQLYTKSRRSTRVSTLDGGAVLVDNGYSASDRSLLIQFMDDISQANMETLQRMVERLSRVRVFTSEGAYTAHPKSITSTGMTLEIIA